MMPSFYGGHDSFPRLFIEAKPLVFLHPGITTPARRREKDRFNAGFGAESHSPNAGSQPPGGRSFKTTDQLPKFHFFLNNFNVRDSCNLSLRLFRFKTILAEAFHISWERRHPAGQPGAENCNTPAKRQRSQELCRGSWSRCASNVGWRSYPSFGKKSLAVLQVAALISSSGQLLTCATVSEISFT